MSSSYDPALQRKIVIVKMETDTNYTIASKEICGDKINAHIFMRGTHLI